MSDDKKTLDPTKQFYFDRQYRLWIGGAVPTREEADEICRAIRDYHAMVKVLREAREWVCMMHGAEDLTDRIDTLLKEAGGE